jgi:hypothetical protein
MALPTVPVSVLDAVTPEEMGKASGINYMAQRFGTVFALAIATAVFTAHGHLGSPAAVTAGFRPALWACVCFAVLGALSAIAMSLPGRGPATEAEPADAEPTQAEPTQAGNTQADPAQTEPAVLPIAA